jgi:hypothetical protein
VIAWLEDMAAGGYDLRASRYVGTNWTAATTLATNVGFNRDLGAAAGAAGEAVVAWVGRLPSGDDVAYSRRFWSGSWQATTQHSASGAQRVDAVQVAMNPNGRLVVSWMQRDATDSFVQVWAQVYSGTWGMAVPVQPAGPSALVPSLPLPGRSVALGDDGAAVLLWTQSGSPWSLRASYLQ